MFLGGFLVRLVDAWREYHSAIKREQSNQWLSAIESTCCCRRRKGCGFDPWVGSVPWRRKWQPTPGFLPGKSHAQRSLVGYSSWSLEESDTTEWTPPPSHLQGPVSLGTQLHLFLSLVSPLAAGASCVTHADALALLWTCRDPSPHMEGYPPDPSRLPPSPAPRGLSWPPFPTGHLPSPLRSWPHHPALVSLFPYHLLTCCIIYLSCLWLICCPPLECILVSTGVSFCFIPWLYPSNWNNAGTINIYWMNK